MNNQEKYLEGKHITLGICACNVINETFDLLHELRDAGATVEIILTPNAAEIMPLVLLQKLSSKPILWKQLELPKVFDPDHSAKPDLLLIAPASVNTVSKAACGIADNLLTSRILSSKCPIAFSVRSNKTMFYKPAIQRNVKQLKEDGVIFIQDPEIPHKIPSLAIMMEAIRSIVLK